MTISNVLRCEGRCEDVASVFDAKSKHWTGRRREHWRRPKAVGEILRAIIFWPRRSMNVLDKHLLHNQFMVHHTLLHVVLSRFHFILMICKLFTFLSISFCLDPHTWIVWKQGQCQHVNVGWIYLLYPFTALLIWSCPWCMSSQRGQFSCSYWYFHHTLSLSLSLTEPSFEDISIFALLQPEMSQENDSNWKGWKSLIWQMLTWASHECTTSGSPQEMQSNPQLSQLWGQAMISSMEEKTCGCHGCWWIITSSWFQLDFWFSTSQAGRLSIT